MGLYTELMNAHAQKPWLKIVRSAAAAVTLEDKARIFLETLEACQNTKFGGNSTIVAVMDQKAYSCYLALRPAFKKLGGWQEMLPSSNSFNFGTSFTVTTQFGGLEIMTDTYLQQLSDNSGMIVFVDRDLM